ncbi:MAG: hypothetical protein R3324_10950, partial [Halobacteriales archaeon]|nr:hypothetical protein [Halobacteriales archaeon]
MSEQQYEEQEYHDEDDAEDGDTDGLARFGRSVEAVTLPFGAPGESQSNPLVQPPAETVQSVVYRTRTRRTHVPETGPERMVNGVQVGDGRDPAQPCPDPEEDDES